MKSNQFQKLNVIFEKWLAWKNDKSCHHIYKICHFGKIWRQIITLCLRDEGSPNKISLKIKWEIRLILQHLLSKTVVVSILLDNLVLIFVKRILNVTKITIFVGILKENFVSSNLKKFLSFDQSEISTESRDISSWVDETNTNCTYFSCPKFSINFHKS